VLDPIFLVGIGLLGSLVAGPAVAYGLDRLPQQRRRTAQWLLIGGAVLITVVADLWSDGPVAGAIVYVIAALPGFVTFLAFRMLVASAFVSLAPLYFVIALLTRNRQTYAPEIALDRAALLEPAWMIVYGSLYVFVGILPLLVVRQRELFRRALQGYLLVMLVAYAGFLIYPTVAPRPADVPGDGFAAWSLRLAYSLDPPYNCFPSLHVAWAFVSALTCYRVHRGVGAAAALWAGLIGASTMYTKQHYFVDVAAGAFEAFVAYVLFLRTYPREAVPEIDRRRAPVRAPIVAAIYGITIAGFWVAYRLQLF
jgi:membrane-associated phospholipid phosphatase